MFNDFFINRTRLLLFAVKNSWVFSLQFVWRFCCSNTWKGNINEPADHRGIILVSAMGKLLWIKDWLNWQTDIIYIVKHKRVLRKILEQCTTFPVLHGEINHLLNRNKRLFVVFVDYTKAFDFVVKFNIW